MTQTSDAYQMMIDGVMDATDTITRSPAPVYAYHILKRPNESHWTARYHQMIFSDPVGAEEAVQRVATGLSCYVEADGLQTAVDQLAQLGVVVNREAQGAGKRSA